MSEMWLKVPLNVKLLPEMREMARSRGLELERWCSEVLMDQVSVNRLSKVKASGGVPVLPGNKR